MYYIKDLIENISKMSYFSWSKKKTYSHKRKILDENIKEKKNHILSKERF